MKAVVMELRKDKAAVLDHEGIIRIIDNEGYKIGQVIQVETLLETDNVSVGKFLPLRRFLQKNAVSVAASLAIFVTAGGTAAAAYNLPYSEVTMGRETTVRYTLNIFDRIIDVSSEGTVNAETLEKLTLRFKGKKIEEAVSDTMEIVESPDYETSSHFNHEDALERKINAALTTWKEDEELRQKTEPIETKAVHEAEGPDIAEIKGNDMKVPDDTAAGHPGQPQRVPDGPQGRMEIGATGIHGGNSEETEGNGSERIPERHKDGNESDKIAKDSGDRNDRSKEPENPEAGEKKSGENPESAADFSLVHFENTKDLTGFPVNLTDGMVKPEEGSDQELESLSENSEAFPTMNSEAVEESLTETNQAFEFGPTGRPDFVPVHEPGEYNNTDTPAEGNSSEILSSGNPHDDRIHEGDIHENDRHQDKEARDSGHENPK